MENELLNTIISSNAGSGVVLVGLYVLWKKVDKIYARVSFLGERTARIEGIMNGRPEPKPPALEK